MRLIDADKLMEVMMTTCLKEIDNIDGPIGGMIIAMDKIYHAPTVKGEKNE